MRGDIDDFGSSERQARNLRQIATSPIFAATASTAHFAPGLDEQVRSDLQSEIQAVLERTLRRVQSAQPAAGREPPSDDEIREMIRAQLSSPQRPPAPERQRPQSNGGIRVATSGLNLPPEDRRTFQSEVQQLVQERLGGMSPAQSRPQVTACGCPPFGGCCWPPAGILGT